MYRLHREEDTRRDQYLGSQLNDESQFQYDYTSWLVTSCSLPLNMDLSTSVPVCE